MTNFKYGPKGPYMDLLVHKIVNPKKNNLLISRYLKAYHFLNLFFDLPWFY